MSLYCQKCQTATAVVHVTELKEGKKVELHLCDDCAEAQDYGPKASNHSMLEIFQQFMEKTSARRGRDRACPECGMTFSEFKSKGRFGCAKDYDVFQGRLAPILERIHGASHQSGAPETTEEPDPSETEPEIEIEIESTTEAPEPRVEEPPADASKRVDRQKKLHHLQRALRRVIEAENYEEAAQLRDKIQALEQQLEDEDL